jgi:hypothetical protein
VAAKFRSLVTFVANDENKQFANLLPAARILIFFKVAKFRAFDTVVANDAS